MVYRSRIASGPMPGVFDSRSWPWVMTERNGAHSLDDSDGGFVEVASWLLAEQTSLVPA